MATDKMFEMATKTKVRFPFRGQISVEDLWDLSLENLDSIFKTLNSQQKKVNEESLLETKSPEDKEIDTKVEIVKYIFNEKKKEANARLKEKEMKDFEQKLLKIKASKQEEELQNKSPEEIDEMLENLRKTNN